MADRVGVIRQGELILVEEKSALMSKLGRKELKLQLAEPLDVIPAELSEWQLELGADKRTLTYRFDAGSERTGIPSLLAAMRDLGIAFKDLETRQSSLEEIFVGLIREERSEAA
jgi:ABC-2 type transport system ATP-binding protein